MADLHHDSALSVRLPRALRNELDELARRLSSEVAVVTTAEVVRLLIREGLQIRKVTEERAEIWRGIEKQRRLDECDPCANPNGWRRS